MDAARDGAGRLVEHASGQSFFLLLIVGQQLLG